MRHATTSLLFWLAAAVVAAGAGVAVSRAAPPGGAAGATVEVAVARRALHPGEVLEAADLEWRALPAGAVAATAVSRDDPDPTGRVVVAEIEADEAIIPARLAPAGLHGVAARTPAGRRAVTVPRDERTPPLEGGQHVDLYAPPAALLAADAVVVAADDHGVTITVDDARVAAVVAALVDGRVVVVVHGPPDATRPAGH